MSWFASLFAFVPPHVLALVGVLSLVVILARWGDLIFLAYALWTYWNGQQIDAVCYLVIALWIGWLKACWMLGVRLCGYRAPWV